MIYYMVFCLTVALVFVIRIVIPVYVDLRVYDKIGYAVLLMILTTFTVSALIAPLVFLGMLSNTKAMYNAFLVESKKSIKL